MRIKGALTALFLLAAALTAVVPAIEELAPSPASAATGCAGFQDDFAADYPGTLNLALWDQSGPIAEALGQQLGTPLAPPNERRSDQRGWTSNSGGFSALQSSGTCAGPFTFSTVFETNSGLNRFDISLVGANLSEDVTVEGSTKGPNTGIWTGNSLSPAGAQGSYELDANPWNHVLYAVTISVDAAGNASVTLANYNDGRVLGTSPSVTVGTGALFVVLGGGPGAVTWGTASIIPPPQPCSVQDDFGADPGLSPYWTSSTSAPESVLTSVASTIGANFVPPALDFSYAQKPGAGMFLGGVQADNEFTAVQSVDACAAPFTFSATVEGDSSYAGSSFDIDLVSQDLSQTLSVEGNLGPPSSGYGIWADNTLAPTGSNDLVKNPANNTIYTITVTVDSTGSATVAVSNPSGKVLGSIGGLGLGTGPSSCSWASPTGPRAGRAHELHYGRMRR